MTIETKTGNGGTILSLGGCLDTAAAGGTIVLSGMNETVANVFDVTGLTDIFEIVR